MTKNIFIAAAIFFGNMLSLAAVTVPDIFSNGAVLAKREDVPVFGKGTPGEKVTVKFDRKVFKTTVGADGKWEVVMDLKNSPAGPFELHINDKIIRDVVVGEVFLAAGQSNMEFKLYRAEGFKEIVKLPPNKFLRYFKVKNHYAASPISEVQGKWVSADPATLVEYCAVGYFFAKKLHDTLNVPVGVVNASWGGTALECWMSKESLAPFPETVAIGDARLKALNTHPERLQKFLKANSAWEKKYGRTDIPVKFPPEDAKWLPHSGDVRGGGICWLRNRITLTEKDVKDRLRIYFGRIYAPMKVFIDGKEVADGDLETAWSYSQFGVYVPAGTFTAGTHEVLIRYWISHDKMHMPQPFRFGSFNIDGKNWEIYREKSFPVCSGDMLEECPAPLGQAPMPERQWSRLYNAMIHPLIPYRFSAILWYQGEGNAARYANYGKVFSSLITDWRKKFRHEDLPFYFCQLPSFMMPSENPGNCGNWPYLRQEQYEASKLPGTGMAVTTDAGECRDIHPLNKKVPGERMAALALKYMYGKDIPYKSPEAVKAVRHGKNIEITFSHTDGGFAAAAIPETIPLKKSNRTFTRL
ncbi:MAG: hypothetical protein J6R86_00680, partial [Lentisphaeria bacterium]|nr:hypothetical protein [Lentisphaeria bacterium]